MKDKVTNPVLKGNLNIESISNYFANILSGNEVINNIEVKKLAHLNKLEVGEKLKVEGESELSNVKVKENFYSKVFNITDDRITFNPEATIKMSNSKLVFRIKDIFEVITFMKYIVKICGNKLEKCNFGNLLKNNHEQIKQVMKLFEEKQNDLNKLILQSQQALLTQTNNQPVKQKNLRKEVASTSTTSKEKSKVASDNASVSEANIPVTPTPLPATSKNIVSAETPNYSFKEKQIKKSNDLLFEHQDEIEKELNLQLKLYKEKQRQEMFENSYEQFLNNNSNYKIADEQTLNDYYYNLDTSFLV